MAAAEQDILQGALSSVRALRNNLFFYSTTNFPKADGNSTVFESSTFRLRLTRLGQEVENYWASRQCPHKYRNKGNISIEAVQNF